MAETCEGKGHWVGRSQVSKPSPRPCLSPFPILPAPSMALAHTGRVWWVFSTGLTGEKLWGGVFPQVAPHARAPACWGQEGAGHCPVSFLLP